MEALDPEEGKQRIAMVVVYILFTLTFSGAIIRSMFSSFLRELGKRMHTPPCSSAELFFAERKGVHRGKISVVDMVFLAFIGFLYPPLAWKVFLCSQKIGRKHPSRDVIFSGQNVARKCQR